MAGLRLVGHALEFLDAAGVPRLRVAPPYVVDALGDVREATLSVAGCAFDASPRAPWGRAVTAPGATRCAVGVTWKGATYPALVEPIWTSTGSMTTSRENHTATLLGSGEVLIVGGVGGAAGEPLESAELYSPSTGTFAAAASMGTPRTLHTATLLDSGFVLVAGGSVGTGAGERTDVRPGNRSVRRHGQPQDRPTEPDGHPPRLGGGPHRRWDRRGLPRSSRTRSSTIPRAGKFAVGADMATPRTAHTATLLASGKVLVAGGYDLGYLGRAELFEPSTGAFVTTGAMRTAREFPATLLPSGKVLIAGGIGAAGPLSSAPSCTDPTGRSFARTGMMTAAGLPRPPS